MNIRKTILEEHEIPENWYNIIADVMKAYGDYFEGNIKQHELSQEDITASIAKLGTPTIPARLIKKQVSLIKDNIH